MLTLDVGGQRGEPYRDSAKAAGQRLTAQIFSPRSSRWGAGQKLIHCLLNSWEKHDIFNVKDLDLDFVVLFNIHIMSKNTVSFIFTRSLSLHI